MVDDESGRVTSARAEELAAVLEAEFSGSARLVRVRPADDPRGVPTLAVLVTVDPDQSLPVGKSGDDVPAPEDTASEGMPNDVAARCEVTIARAHVERAEEDLLVVTRRLPGSPEQQAQAHQRLAEARERLLLKEATAATLGADQPR